MTITKIGEKFLNNNTEKTAGFLSGAKNLLTAKGARGAATRMTGKYQDDAQRALMRDDQYVNHFKNKFSKNPEYAVDYSNTIQKGTLAGKSQAKKDLLKGIAGTGATYGGIGAAGYGGLKALQNKEKTNENEWLSPR